ncbi:669_t:CDS:2 [Entrophospora sp. SA101]|nr:669_t:CDS:2 [Entrophospora sp. SA101]
MPSLEEQINKLEKILSNNEVYINYLEKEISNRDEELEEIEILPNTAEAKINQDTQTILRLNSTVQKSNDEMRLMTMAYYNEKEERQHWYFSYKDKHRRIVELVREKFATQLLLRTKRQKLQQKLNTCQNDLLLSDIQLDNKWGKWKNRSRNYEQIIINQNQNILNLQNNIANQPNMATIHEIYLILQSPLIGFQADMVIPALYTHLPPDLRSTVKMYMSIRGGNTTIDNFFADLKKCWIERQAGNNSIQPTLINQQQTNNALDILANLAQRLGYSGDLTDYNQMQKYIENDLYRNYGRQIHNMKNEPFEPQRKIYATKQPASRKVIITNKNSRQCSICKKVGHTKINCPKLKRVRRVNNISQYENNENDENEEYIEYVEYDEEEIIDADNEEVILEDDENEYIDFEPQETNYENQVFLESIKYIISSLIPHCPKEILSELYAFIRKLFPEMENTFHSYYTKNYSSKERDMVWKNLIKKYQFILVPLIYIINSHKESQSQESITDNRPLNHAIKLYQEAQLIRDWPNPLEINFLQIKEPNNYATIPCKIYDLEIPHALLDTGSDGSHLSDNIADYIEKYFDWPNPLEINFLQIKEPNNYATIPYKIYDLEIPHALLDTGSDGSHLSDNIADYIEKYFGLKMDRKKAYRLSGAVGEKQSIGTFHDIPITIGIGNDTVNISDEFSVLPTEKDHNGKDISLFILGTRWQHRAGWEPIVKGEFKASCNGKTITIPLSVHKPQQNVFSKATINNVEKKN